jgi:hypothetical protein
VGGVGGLGAGVGAGIVACMAGQLKRNRFLGKRRAAFLRPNR